MTNPDDVYGPPGVPRDRWQRPLIVPPGGGKPVAYTRCTTFAGSVEDTYNLSKWQQRMVALGLAERPDLMVSVAAHYDDKEELNKICETAIEAAKGKAAAGVGTALHKLTDRLDRGEPLGPVPAEYRADLDAFAEATKPLTVLGMERFVVLDDMKIGGTFDRLYEFEGRRYIGDTKSGSIEFGAGKIAMQLAIYSRSVLYSPETKERESLGDVDQDRAIVMHLPAGQGRCELKWVNIKAGWDAVQLAADVRKWRSKRGLIVDLAAYRVPFDHTIPHTDRPDCVLDSACGTCGGSHCASYCKEALIAAAEADAINLLKQTVPAVEVPLTQQINEAADQATLERLWSDNRGVWTDEHTAAAKKRKQQLHQKVLKNAVKNQAAA